MTETGVELSKSDKTREEVLSAAARLFRHEGYYATTMRDIAEKSGIEAGSIYYHFDSKEENFMNFMNICSYLEQLFKGKKVDVVTKNGLSPYLGPEILKNVEYV